MRTELDVARSVVFFGLLQVRRYAHFCPLGAEIEKQSNEFGGEAPAPTSGMGEMISVFFCPQHSSSFSSLLCFPL